MMTNGTGISIATHAVENLATQETDTAKVLAPNGVGGVQWVTGGGGGGGGGGAPTNAEYLVGAADATLTAERVVTDTSTIAWDLATAGQAKANVVAGSIGTTQLADNATTNAKLADMAANTVKVRAQATAGDPEDLAVPTNTVVGRQGGNIVAAQVATGQIADGAVTYAKIQNVTAGVLLGRGTGGAGAPQEITIGSGLSLTGTTLSATGGGGAPTDAEYFVRSAHAGLSAERVVTDTPRIKWSYAVPGQVTADIETDSVAWNHVAPSMRTRVINFVISGSPITTGIKGHVVVPFDAIPRSWTILADTVGSIVVDVRRATYANFPSVSSIAGSEKPTLSAANKNQDTSLTSWSNINANDILQFFVESVATVTNVTVALVVEQVS